MSNKSRARRVRVRFAAFLLAGAAVALASSGGASGAGPTKIEPRYNLFSEQQDIDLGKQAAADVVKQMPLVKDPTVVKYVQDLGARLVAKSRGPKFPYAFQVVDSSEINAFALPGGPVFVNRGIMENARNDGEVAGVMAHEISHVVLRHGTANMTKAKMSEFGFGILGGLIGRKAGDKAGGLIGAAGGVGLNLYLLKNSRDAETEADVYGVQILARAGYNPGDMISFFETLDKVSKSDHSKTANFLSDHPTPDRRIERIGEEAKALKVKQARTTTTEGLAPVQAILKKMPAASNKALAKNAGDKGSGGKGNTGGGAGTSQSGQSAQTAKVAQPSSQLVAYSNKTGGYRLSHPSNWKAYEGTNGSATIAPDGGIVQRGDASDVVYGAIAGRYRNMGTASAPEADDGSGISSTLRLAFADLKSQIREASPYLVKKDGTQNQYLLAKGGQKGVVFEGTNPATGVNEHVVVVAREFAADRIVYLLFITPAGDAAAYERTLTGMLGSLAAQ